jgi:N-formylglutamate deformylase
LRRNEICIAEFQRVTQIFDFQSGDTPLLVSVPHDGRLLAPGQADRMTDIGRGIPDTDWHVRELYSFAKELGASVISANYSRYVVDLNRPANDVSLYENQIATGLCPQKSFAGSDIYQDGFAVGAQEQRGRVDTYWRPYHDAIEETLQRLKRQHGYALLWDAHSIPSEVPLLFDGQLPDLNIGTNNAASCAANITAAVASVAQTSPFSNVVNGRFQGGQITRAFGSPRTDIHAIQLELTQRNYMDENTLSYDAKLAARLARTIKDMLQSFLAAAQAHCKSGQGER